MLVMKIFANILGAFIEVLILNTFLSIFGKPRRKSFLFCGAIVFITINVATVMLIQNQGIFIGITLILIFAYSCLFDVTNSKRILSVIFIFVFVVVFEMLIGLALGAITGLSVEQLQNNIIYYLIGIVMSKLLMYCGARILKHFIKQKKERLNILTVIPFIILPIASIFVLYGLSKYAVSSVTVGTQIYVFTTSLLLIISNIVVFLIYDIVLKQKEDKHIAERQIMQFKLEQSYHKNLLDKQMESNKTIHDIKNKFYAIKTLLVTDYDAAIKEIDNMCDILEGMATVKITGVESVDALINAKKIYAQKRNILITCKSIIMDEYNLDPIDFCIVMGNLLDNSIEACEKIVDGNKKISVIIIKQQNFLNITITNPNHGNGKMKGATLTTTKSDKLLHGYGLDNVSEVVKKYNGMIKYGIEDEEFKVNLILEVDNINENSPIST